MTDKQVPEFTWEQLARWAWALVLVTIGALWRMVRSWAGSRFEEQGEQIKKNSDDIEDLKKSDAQQQTAITVNSTKIDHTSVQYQNLHSSINDLHKKIDDLK